MKNFLSLHDVNDLDAMINQALSYKAQPRSQSHLGSGKTLGLVFMNPSLRTRLSTQRAAYNLGMDVMVININQDSWNLEFQDGAIMDGQTVEHVKDAANVMSQYCDIIGIRTFAGLQDRQLDYQEQTLNSFVKYTSVPVISMESATLHPLQSLADLVTIREYQSVPKPKIVLSWAPHPKPLPQAVANSFLQWADQLEGQLTVTHPPGYELNPEYTEGCRIIHDQAEAFAEADFIYAKNWSSYESYGKVLSTDKSWTIDDSKMALTNNARFMHCLPIRRNMIATDSVIDQSLVVEQAHNRIFAAQAVLTEILENS